MRFAYVVSYFALIASTTSDTHADCADIIGDLTQQNPRAETIAGLGDLPAIIDLIFQPNYSPSSETLAQSLEQRPIRSLLAQIAHEFPSIAASQSQSDAVIRARLMDSSDAAVGTRKFVGRKLDMLLQSGLTNVQIRNLFEKGLIGRLFPLAAEPLSEAESDRVC